MGINAIWAAIEPYVTGLAGTATGGIIVGIICRLLQGKLLQRLDVSEIADKVAGRLAGKTLNIDVTAITEKRLDKIDTKLNKKVEAVTEQVSSFKLILALIGGALVHLKSLSNEERQALQEAIKALNAEYKPPAPEQVATVKLEPIIFDDEKEEKAENIGGISL